MSDNSMIFRVNVIMFFLFFKIIFLVILELFYQYILLKSYLTRKINKKDVMYFILLSIYNNLV